MALPSAPPLSSSALSGSSFAGPRADYAGAEILGDCREMEQLCTQLLDLSKRARLSSLFHASSVEEATTYWKLQASKATKAVALSEHKCQMLEREVVELRRAQAAYEVHVVVAIKRWDQQHPRHRDIVCYTSTKIADSWSYVHQAPGAELEPYEVKLTEAETTRIFSLFHRKILSDNLSADEAEDGRQAEVTAEQGDPAKNRAEASAEKGNSAEAAVVQGNRAEEEVHDTSDPEDDQKTQPESPRSNVPETQEISPDAVRHWTQADVVKFLRTRHGATCARLVEFLDHNPDIQLTGTRLMRIPSSTFVVTVLSAYGVSTGNSPGAEVLWDCAVLAEIAQSLH
eukprot:m51a1_g2235 hypothetical protein (342) ;mRNA; f:252271-260648